MIASRFIGLCVWLLAGACVFGQYCELGGAGPDCGRGSRTVTSQPSRTPPPPARNTIPNSAAEAQRQRAQAAYERVLESQRQQREAANQAARERFGRAAQGPSRATGGPVDMGDFPTLYRNMWNEKDFQSIRADMERRGIHVPSPDEFEGLMREGGEVPPELSGMISRGRTVDGLKEASRSGSNAINRELEDTMKRLSPQEEQGNPFDAGCKAGSADAQKLLELRDKLGKYQSALADIEATAKESSGRLGAASSYENFTVGLGVAEMAKGAADAIIGAVTTVNPLFEEFAKGYKKLSEIAGNSAGPQAKQWEGSLDLISMVLPKKGSNLADGMAKSLGAANLAAEGKLADGAKDLAAAAASLTKDTPLEKYGKRLEILGVAGAALADAERGDPGKFVENVFGTIEKASEGDLSSVAGNLALTAKGVRTIVNSDNTFREALTDSASMERVLSSSHQQILNHAAAMREKIVSTDAEIKRLEACQGPALYLR